MADAPRRSSRRPKAKQRSTYSVGDVVEIMRNNAIEHGHLMYKLTEGPTPNPRWLVAFDGQSGKGEELYEQSFGKTVATAEVKEQGQRKASRNKGSKSSKGPSSKTSNSSKSSDSEQSGSNKKKKAVGFSESSMVGSEDDSSRPGNTGSDSAKVSAREQRSRRRQAMTSEEGSDALLPDGKKRPRPGSSSSKGGSNGNNGKSNKKVRKNEDMVKIPMLTGTLYLYRGPYRRAEFIRKV